MFVPWHTPTRTEYSLRKDIRSCNSNKLETVSNAGAEGVEPSYSVLETEILPLNDAPYAFSKDIIEQPKLKSNL